MTLNNFMQTTSQLLIFQTQIIAHLEMQLDQLVMMFDEQEEDKLPSQLEVEPKVQNGPESKQKDQCDQLKIFRSRELVEISEIKNTNEISTPSDHYSQPKLKLFVEPLITLVL